MKKKNNEISAKKLEYLYYLYLNMDDYIKQNQIADFFGVTKVTISNYMTDLEKKELVKKNVKKRIKISEKGKKLINNYLPDIKVITNWLCDEYDLDYTKAITEAIRFCTSMSTEMVNKVKILYELNKAKKGIYTADNIKKGVYDIGFSVLNKDESSVSMGDRGFVKPCKLVCSDNSSEVILRAHEFRYRLLRGKLIKLSYRNRYGEYVETENKNDRYTIPLKAFKMEEYEDHIICKIHIKALSSCGIINMPESEAILRLRVGKALFCEQVS